MTGTRLRLPPLLSSLSARLLLLTIAFVMLSEVLIYAPSIGRYRLTFLEGRLAAGHLAILALEATDDNMVTAALEQELLDHVNAYSVALSKPEDNMKLMLMVETPGEIDASYDLRKATFFSLIGDALMTLWHGENRLLRVVGGSPKDPGIVVDIVLDEAPMRMAMLDFSKRILALSFGIALITAALVYLSLHWLMVRPMRRITSSMVAFRAVPEDVTTSLPHSDREDEIGIAQRELTSMQEGLRSALHQKTRLAALGTAVSKINHDLRNILATAALVSDRLTGSDDPEVRRVTPTLLRAIDRAVNLCAQTLNFTREGPPVLDLSHFDLCDLVQDVGEGLPESSQGAAVWSNCLEAGTDVEADRDQLFRVLSNLGQNAIQAGAREVSVSAHRDGDRFIIVVSDNGPGLPLRAREKLFQPFEGSVRSDGTGLGLAIARDLMRAHGGDIELEASSTEGTRFCLVLPITQSRLRLSAAGRAAA